MRKQKIVKWLAVAVSIVIIGFVSVIFLVIGTDTEEKETAQSDQEIEDNIPNEQEVKEKRAEEKKEDVSEDIAEEEVNPFPNDSFSHAGLSEARFEEYLYLMENDNKEITQDRLEWLIEGLDFVPEEYRAGYKERINSLKDKVQ